MDAIGLAATMTGARSAQTQFVLAAKMMTMNAQADASVAAMIEAAQQNAASLANAANGVGGNLDVSV
jgi:hypothetical protein